MNREIQQLSTTALKIYPRNSEFYDDITGEEYERFKTSIEQDGILSPIIAAPDLTVISGHQRLRAAKEIEISLVPVIIRDDLEDDENKLKALIAAKMNRKISLIQKKQLIHAVHQRVIYLLEACGFKYTKWRFRPLIMQLWCDAKKYASLGATIEETHIRHYQTVLDYIDIWFPSNSVINIVRDADEKHDALEREVLVTLRNTLNMLLKEQGILNDLDKEIA